VLVQVVLLLVAVLQQSALRGTVVSAETREPLSLSIVTLHAHIGTGPELPEFSTNLRRLMEFFAAAIIRVSQSLAG